MADGKGFKVVVKINLPPEEQYHSGHSVIFQGDTPEEVELLLAQTITPVEKGEPDKNAFDQARFILLRFIEFAQQGAVKATLDTPSGAEGATQGGGPTAEGQNAASTAAAAPDLASAAVLKAVAKKTGKSVEELGELTTADAQKLLKREVK